MAARRFVAVSKHSNRGPAELYFVPVEFTMVLDRFQCGEMIAGSFDLVGGSFACLRESGDAALGTDQLVLLEPLQDALHLRLVGIAEGRVPAAGVGQVGDRLVWEKHCPKQGVLKV